MFDFIDNWLEITDLPFGGEPDEEEPGKDDTADGEKLTREPDQDEEIEAVEYDDFINDEETQSVLNRTLYRTDAATGKKVPVKASEVFTQGYKHGAGADRLLETAAILNKFKEKPGDAPPAVLQKIDDLVSALKSEKGMTQKDRKDLNSTKKELMEILNDDDKTGAEKQQAIATFLFDLENSYKTRLDLLERKLTGSEQDREYNEYVSRRAKEEQEKMELQIKEVKQNYPSIAKSQKALGKVKRLWEAEARSAMDKADSDMAAKGINVNSLTPEDIRQVYDHYIANEVGTLSDVAEAYLQDIEEISGNKVKLLRSRKGVGPGSGRGGTPKKPKIPEGKMTSPAVKEFMESRLDELLDR